MLRQEHGKVTFRKLWQADELTDGHEGLKGSLTSKKMYMIVSKWQMNQVKG